MHGGLTEVAIPSFKVSDTATFFPVKHLII